MTDTNTTISVAGRTIAYRRLDGTEPGIVFFGGFASDMTGTKAMALEDYCRRTGRAYLRFDYSGHGDSSGRFEDGTIGIWAEDAIGLIDQVTAGKQVLVGSSMGGWIALLVARARPEKVAALVGIAAAPDFTEDLMWTDFDEAIRDEIMTKGVYYEPSDYGEPLPITKALIEDGRDQLVLRAPLDLPFPVRLIQGMKDPDVPWRHALRLTDHITGGDVELTLVKDGDHRLSDPADLARLDRTLDSVFAAL